MAYVIIIFLLIALLDLRPQLKKSPKRDRVVVITIFVFVFSLCLLVAIDVQIPSPMLFFGELFESLGLAYSPL